MSIGTLEVLFRGFVEGSFNGLGFRVWGSIRVLQGV